ncbi:AMP-binding protein-like protein, partial [Leptotrombidium deliense]
NTMEGKSLKPFVMFPYSYAFGKSTKTINYESLATCLEYMASKYPNKKAVVSVHENIEKTFQQLNADANQLANSLSRVLNIMTGDVVAIMTANCYNFVVVQYACAKIGAIICPINAYYQSSELEFCLKKVNPKVLFLPSRGSAQEFTVNKIFDVFAEIGSSLPSKLTNVVLLDGDCENAITLHFCDLKFYSFYELITMKTELSADHINNNSCWSVDADEVSALYFTSLKQALKLRFLHEIRGIAFI